MVHVQDLGGEKKTFRKRSYMSNQLCKQNCARIHDKTKSAYGWLNYILHMRYAIRTSLELVNVAQVAPSHEYTRSDQNVSCEGSYSIYRIRVYLHGNGVIYAPPCLLMLYVPLNCVIQELLRMVGGHPNNLVWPRPQEHHVHHWNLNVLMIAKHYVRCLKLNRTPRLYIPSSSALK